MSCNDDINVGCLGKRGLQKDLQGVFAVADLSADSLFGGNKRLAFVFISILLAYLVIAVRLIDVSSMSCSELAEVISHEAGKSANRRANILDRNGMILATNIETFSVYAHPRQIIRMEEAAAKVAAVLKLNEKDILKKLKGGKQFIWIKRHITPYEQEKIRSLGIPGIYEMVDEKRVYPTERLFSHLVGYVDVDGNGIAGIERSFDETLLGSDQSLKLSVDARVQHALREELLKSIGINSAVGGFGIVADVMSGEIVAMVSLPDFDPHQTNKKDKNTFNHATLAVHEMGSTFKILTIAMGLDTDKIRIDEAFDVSSKLKIGRFEIGDYRGKGGLLSVPEILMYSSNIGAAQIARKVGIAKQKEYWRKIGMLSLVNLPLPELGRPIYPSGNKWGDVHLITMSYGHGIAVTALHTIQAIGAVVNGGILHEPQILKMENDGVGDPSGAIPEGKRVFSAKTSNTMRGMLRLVVEQGGAKKAEVPGYFIGGKTGTSEKVQNGGYNKKLNLSSCIGVFPIHDPKYIIFVAIDEAKSNRINAGFTTGGMIAAPIAGEVIRKMTGILGVRPYNPDDTKIAKQLYVEYTPRYRMLASR